MSPQQGLASVQRPVTADVLSSWLGSGGWMRNHLPNLARVVEPLQKLKNEASKLVGSPMVVRPQAHQPRRDGHVQPLDDVAWGATIALLRNAIAPAYVTQAGHACAGGVLRRLRHGLGHAGRAVPA